MFEEMATVLVIGSGGREHAICWKLAQSEEVWLLVLCHILTILFVQDLYVMQLLLCVISHRLCSVLSGLHKYDKQASGKWLMMVVRYNDFCCCLTHSVEQSLGKLIVSHLLKKLATFYRKWRFNTVLTSAHHWIQSWARCAQCNTYCICFSEYVWNFFCVFKFILMTVTLNVWCYNNKKR